MTALTNYLTGPTQMTNKRLLNAMAAAYTVALDMSELGLELTSRFELDASPPIIWIRPPQDPVHLFGAYARVVTDYHRTPRRYASAMYRDHLICWDIN